MVLIIALDPSGNFTEGNGTTGICEIGETGATVDDIHAGFYETAEAYWDGHIQYLEDCLNAYQDIEVVIEGFRLYEHKANTQIHSILETPQLIGVLRHWCYVNKIPSKIQYAPEVKTRWSDKVLINTGVIEIVNRRRKLISSGQPLNNHKTDALRHALHYQRYRKT